MTIRKAFGLALLVAAAAPLAPVFSGDFALIAAGDLLGYLEVLSAVAVIAVRSGRASAFLCKKVRLARLVASNGAAWRRARERSASPARRPSRRKVADEEGGPLWAFA